MTSAIPLPKVLFSDYFGVDKGILDDFGAFDISLVADLPLFIDPFLLFHSPKPEYQDLHAGIIRYLTFLRDTSVGRRPDRGALLAWYSFKEVKQNWLGFSAHGNRGSALGEAFATALNDNFNRLFGDYGDERVTRSAHLEKLCLIQPGVGRDNISDFTTNLIKDYLCRYTQEFATAHLAPHLCHRVRVQRVRFNYDTESWQEVSYVLPAFGNDFVMLTPKDMLTRDDTWINRSDLIDAFEDIPPSIPDEALRSQINNYFLRALPKRPIKKDERAAAAETISRFPAIIDYYIKRKEDNGDRASDISIQKVGDSENLYLERFTRLGVLLRLHTPFYQTSGNSYTEALKRVHYLKSVIENNDGYRYFYGNDDEPIRKEEDLKIAYRLTWFGTPFDFNTEVNNGRGPVDVKASMGARDTTVVELKLASNSQLEKNLRNQLEVYKEANRTQKGIKVIVYFSAQELAKCRRILKSLGLEGEESVVLIDARRDNKISASKAG